MTTIGVNVVADGTHPPEWTRAFGATSVRIVLTPQYDLTDYFQHCVDRGVSLLPLIARESGSSDRQLAEYVDRYGRFFERLQVGNEADHESPSSWTMTPAELSDLGWRVKRAFSTKQLVCAGMVSGNPAYLDDVDLRPFDYVAVHPYAKDMTPNDLPQIDALVQEYLRFGRPIVISEWGWWGPEYEGVQRVGDVVAWAAATDEIDSYYHFCMADTMVWPFGLLREDGSWKPAAYAFRHAATAVSETDVPVIGDGLKRELDRRGWTPTSGEYQVPIARAATPSGQERLVLWDGDGATAWRKVG